MVGGYGIRRRYFFSLPFTEPDEQVSPMVNIYYRRVLHHPLFA